MGEHLDNEGENLENLEREGEHVMIWVCILTMRVITNEHERNFCKIQWILIILSFNSHLQVTVGIIACVEVSTTTVGTTPERTMAPPTEPTPGTTASQGTPSATPAPPTSGTTTVPTSVTTTTVCQKDMAVVGGQYVSSVTYSVPPVDGTNNDDLTSTTSNGITFTPVSGITGLFDDNNQPLYQITITFNQAGVDSLGSITVNPTSNVNRFAVQFFTQSNPNQPVTLAPELADKPVELTSTIINSRPAIVDFPSQLPSPIGAIRILILSTSDNE